MTAMIECKLCIRVISINSFISDDKLFVGRSEDGANGRRFHRIIAMKLYASLSQLNLENNANS